MLYLSVGEWPAHKVLNTLSAYEGNLEWKQVINEIKSAFIFYTQWLLLYRQVTTNAAHSRQGHGPALSQWLVSPGSSPVTHGLPQCKITLIRWLIRRYTIYCFCFGVEKFCCFCGSLCHCKIHEYLLASVPKIGSVADSRKSFSANEDIQIAMSNRKTLTAKQKQCAVLISGIDRYLAVAWAWTDLHLAGQV